MYLYLNKIAFFFFFLFFLVVSYLCSFLICDRHTLGTEAYMNGWIFPTETIATVRLAGQSLEDRLKCEYSIIYKYTSTCSCL